MTCHICGLRAGCTDSRVGLAWVRRRRVCPKGHRQTTYEIRADNARSNRGFATVLEEIDVLALSVVDGKPVVIDAASDPADWGDWEEELTG